MKKYLALLLSVLLLLSLIACGAEKPPENTPENPPVMDPASPENPPAADPAPPEPGSSTPEKPEIPADPAPPADPEPVKPVTLSGDSYWVAYESEGDLREYVPEGDDLLTDLTLWADGTARIREIEDELWLVSDGDEQNMTWTCAEDGTLHLYTQHSGDTPCWSGTATSEGITLNRFGGTYRFRQEPMPEGGALYSPAELQGVWMIYSSEIEGDESDRSGEFTTLVFETVRNGDEKALVASAEHGEEGELIREDEQFASAYQDREITLLDESIYSGCGNDVWSVRVGEESPLNKHNLPENTEIYVTLLDQNTLLQQQYFSFDQGRIPGVSYQIFRRFLPRVDEKLEKADLEGCDFTLAGYMEADGTWCSKPPEISSFSLRLDSDAYYFSVKFDGGTDYWSGGGYWEMGRGGTLHMTSKGDDQDWLAGAAQSLDGVPELYLWNQGGIMRLTRAEISDGEWDGYVDTMDDLEGRAFAAPENALFVLYNQNYSDLTKLHLFPFYEVDDGPEAQYVLVTSVLDDNYFWLDEDGFCREDFGTVHAGESFVIRVNIPESDGYRLQVESVKGNYFLELIQSKLDMYQHWNYILA